ncbi:MAG: short-chain alcohol dehydrogenase [Acidimicrobiaceae bacterium]|nr:short-chain alcohol dehydrogenase [Acidimicrobiaceae bacterium]
MKDLVNKVAVVTGGASGIGFAMAERFLHEQMKVVIADVDADALNEATARLGGDSSRVLGVQTDVSIAEEVDRLAARVIEHFGGVQVLCNNCGITAYNFATWETPLKTWEWVIGTNLWGLIHGLRSFVPLMLEADEGHIVNTASGAALLGVPFLGAYSATKHSVLAISEACQRELAAMGSKVKVSVVCPARTTTRFSEAGRSWPDRLGEPQIRGSASTRLDKEATATGWLNGRWQHEFVAGEEVPPSFIANKVFEAIENERFLVVASLEKATMTIARRMLELAGKAPTETG